MEFQTQELFEELAHKILNKYPEPLSNFKFVLFLNVEELGKDNEDKPIFGVNIDNVKNATLNFKGDEYRFDFIQSCRVEGTLDQIKHDALTKYSTNYYKVSDLKVNGEGEAEELEDAINAKLDDCNEEFCPNGAALSSWQTDRIVNFINKKLAK